ncbi:MAG: cation-translocating P-type ATPase, partial [Candidatus Taylorbacteria bacterium]
MNIANDSVQVTTRDWHDIGETALSVLDIILIVATTISLIASFFFHEEKIGDILLASLTFVGLIPVAVEAVKALIKRQLSVDLLAVIALAFSLIAHEWFSAGFITLMLAFARLFDRITAERAKKTIQSLMKYHVERVRIQVGETIKEVHIKEVREGDLVLVESGDRMPVDGIVTSGTADVNESSLTGESELVPKKKGDSVYTATVNESGSLVVRALKVGADTTLSHIISLIDEASRDKNDAERMADRFTQWYIGLSLLAASVMYMYGLSPRTILSVLLVVCADDVAVAVPLAFTSAISRAARRGIIVKGSTVFEQMSHLTYILTDKTGTLTRGKPQVVDIRAYHSWTQQDIVKRFAMGASESRHMVSRAILEYIAEQKIAIHAPDSLNEIPGQGVSFEHDGEHMLMGRLSFLQDKGVHTEEALVRDVALEKDAGRGVVALSVNGEAIGLISYRDELRPHVKEIIQETKKLGVREWHMLTGDNEKAAIAVARELGIDDIHANMTPETKVEVIRQFENKRKKKETVGYIGDGVNDAASLALVDVSIAMGGVGADAAIEAADITIMKDQLSRLPEA